MSQKSRPLSFPMSPPQRITPIALVPAIVSLLAGTTFAQPRGIQPDDQLAPPISPYICKAQAIREGETVVIRLTVSETVLTPRKPDDDESKTWASVWTTGGPMQLGLHAHAYRRSGEKLDAEAVLKALQQPVAVACFERHHKDDPLVPDPFYTAPFREDVVILVYDGKYWLRH